MAERKKSIILYDVGGGIIALTFFGIPFGSIFDYLWNLLVFSIALRYLKRTNKIEISNGKKYTFILFITLLGFVIDWAYFRLTWETNFGKTEMWMPTMSQAYQFTWLLLPAVMIGLVNFALAYSFLKMERRQALFVGIAMAFFTAPWMLPVLPYVFGWIVR